MPFARWVRSIVIGQRRSPRVGQRQVSARNRENPDGSQSLSQSPLLLAMEHCTDLVKIEDLVKRMGLFCIEGNELTMHRARCLSSSSSPARRIEVSVGDQQRRSSTSVAVRGHCLVDSSFSRSKTVERVQFPACCLISSSSPGRIGVSVGVEQGCSSTAVAAGGGSLANLSLGRSKMVEGVSIPAARRGGAVERKIIEMPDRKSEGRLQAMQRQGGDGRPQQQGTGKRPVLLVDVMGTIVRDPFHVDMPAFFGITFKELLACKHPTAWTEFEKGVLTEEEFAVKMFNDRRGYDYEGLKQCMANGYKYLEGMEGLLQRLKAAGMDMHIFSNYPTWYTMIEDKLNLSQYLPWTFVSCHTGLRKPSQDAFLDAAEWLGVHPSDCVFIDDQPSNVEAASNVGMKGIQFQNSQGLEKDLAFCGISLEPLMRSQKIL